jgi:hypothetical protein
MTRPGFGREGATDQTDLELGCFAAHDLGQESALQGIEQRTCA